MVMDLVVAELGRVHERIAGRFGRAERRARVREYVSWLVAGLERKNGWTLAEQAGEPGPDGMQRLPRRADWDVDGVRDDVRDDVVEHLGDAQGVLIGPANPGMIDFTSPEIRRLPVNLILRHARPAQHVWSWSPGGANASTQPGKATTADADTHPPHLI
jgi:hypothetical protein